MKKAYKVNHINIPMIEDWKTKDRGVFLVRVLVRMLCQVFFVVRLTGFAMGCFAVWLVLIVQEVVRTCLFVWLNRALQNIAGFLTR